MRDHYLYKSPAIEVYGHSRFLLPWLRVPSSFFSNPGLKNCRHGRLEDWTDNLRSLCLCNPIHVITKLGLESKRISFQWNIDLLFQKQLNNIMEYKFSFSDEVSKEGRKKFEMSRSPSPPMLPPPPPQSTLTTKVVLYFSDKINVISDVIDALQQSDIDARRTFYSPQKKFPQKSIVQKAPTTVLFISLFKTLSKQVHRNGPQGPD